MPDQETLERAREDAAEGKSPSTQAGEFVREEIEHVREGKHGARSTKQAIAIGLSKARRAGVKLPPPGRYAVGVVFLTFGWRLIPRGRKGQASPEAAFRIEDYVAEARVPADSPYVGRTVAALEDIAEGDLTVAAIIRENYRRYVPSGHWTLFADDVLVLECDPHVLETVVAEARLELVGSKGVDEEALRSAEVTTVEAVVTAGSPLVGSSLVEQMLRPEISLDEIAATHKALVECGAPIAAIRTRQGPPWWRSQRMSARGTCRGGY